jgi:hypothetical protein
LHNSITITIYWPDFSILLMCCYHRYGQCGLASYDMWTRETLGHDIK